MTGDEATFHWWAADALDRGQWGSLIDPVLERIVRARDRDRLPHALMLIGPAGMGRELAAVEIAAMLVCAGSPGPWAAGACAERVRRGLHPDVQALLPEGAGRLITIEPIRERVVATAPGRPYEGECRVWIIDGVEAGRLGVEAANAFLKTLEEPPEHARFILLAENPDAVLPTVSSRCQQLALPGVIAVARELGRRGVPPELAAARASEEEVEAAMDVARNALVTALEGRMRPILRLAETIPETVPPFSCAVAAAVELACARQAGSEGEGLARLAADLIAVEQRTKALNLNPGRQLVSCLLRWYMEARPNE